MASAYAFQPMTPNHLSMIRRWLETPEAVRAYAKAGFERDRIVETADGPVLLMVRNR